MNANSLHQNNTQMGGIVDESAHSHEVDLKCSEKVLRDTVSH